jgi:hypothetical protein
VALQNTSIRQYRVQAGQRIIVEPKPQTAVDRTLSADWCQRFILDLSIFVAKGLPIDPDTRGGEKSTFLKKICHGD